VAALSKAEIQQKLKDLRDWSHQGKCLHKRYTFKSFMPAIAFVNRVAEAAEKAAHHPDITVNYNVVSLALSTHSEGGITEKDFALAGQLDQLTGDVS
jgi:4a-hydroxytetrahydrobiopterin dehydratase